jgi:predicted membrane-bound dolichyl-phosphate-mannose-protein mannosyltransferase
MVFDHVCNFICYFDIWKVLLNSSLVVSNINNFDDDDYLIMYVKFICYIILLTCSISEADASMNFVELQIKIKKEVFQP